jgi:hypothetical protein
MSTPLSGATYAPELDWTAEPQTPAADPLLSLTSYGPSSFTASNLDRFAVWIESAGFQRQPGRSPSEYGRFVRGRQLIVAYFSRTLLVQGQNVDQTRALLGRLAGVE